jgi:MFS transporter, DHA1 family, multidrug resistance protein
METAALPASGHRDLAHGPDLIEPTARPPAVLPLRLLFVLGALSAFGPLSLDLYLPALPQLAQDLRGTEATAQLTMTACMVGLAVGQVFVGPVSDRYGRRRSLLIGVAAYAVSSLLCALAPNMGVLILLRLVQGLAGGIVIARAIVRDLYETTAAAHVFSCSCSSTEWRRSSPPSSVDSC